MNTTTDNFHIAKSSKTRILCGRVDIFSGVLEACRETAFGRLPTPANHHFRLPLNFKIYARPRPQVHPLIVIQIPCPFARRSKAIIIFEDAECPVDVKFVCCAVPSLWKSTRRVFQNNDYGAATGEWPRDLDHDKRVDLNSRARVDFEIQQ